MNIYDSYDVLVSGSVFDRCISSGEFANLPLRALGGGLSLSCIENQLQQTESWLTVQTALSCIVCLMVQDCPSF